MSTCVPLSASIACSGKYGSRAGFGIPAPRSIRAAKVSVISLHPETDATRAADLRPAMLRARRNDAWLRCVAGGIPLAIARDYQGRNFAGGSERCGDRIGHVTRDRAR